MGTVLSPSLWFHYGSMGICPGGQVFQQATLSGHLECCWPTSQCSLMDKPWKGFLGLTKVSWAFAGRIPPRVSRKMTLMQGISSDSQELRRPIFLPSVSTLVKYE